MTQKKVEVKKAEVKEQPARMEDWRILLEWAVNQRRHNVTYHSSEPEIDIWMDDDACNHIKLSPDGTWRID
jgi:hypothetical protein